MKLPSYLVQSRHGVFYFRLTYLVGLIRREKRWSMHTKNPAEAKRLSIKLCALLSERSSTSTNLIDIDGVGVKVGHDQQQECNGMANEKSIPMGLITTVSLFGGRTVKMEVDQNDPKDVRAAQKLMKVVIAQDVKENGLGSPDHWPNQTHAIVQSALATTPVKTNSSILELIERYQSRNKDRQVPKTSYEYERMQRKFFGWVSAKYSNDQHPLSELTRGDIAEFIDKLQKDEVSLQTIQKKYLAALSGLFDYAQSAGEYPAGELPTKNHKIYTSRDKRKSVLSDGYKQFSYEELSRIFNPTDYLKRDKPDDYWLPLLGLFTGGRISELCQLKPHNIRQIEGIWSIDINEDDKDQSVKTAASIRVIPIHPTLIDLGFLDYVEDAKVYGGIIFPYLNLDRFNNYSKTPSTRFGSYLNRLLITNKQKVFHSFRSTSNNRLKENGVGEESRCQFVGHVYGSVNSNRYSEKHGIRFLLDNVAIHLTFSCVKFDELAYPRELMKERLCLLMKKKEKFLAHKAAKEARSKS